MVVGNHKVVALGYQQSMYSSVDMCMVAGTDKVQHSFVDTHMVVGMGMEHYSSVDIHKVAGMVAGKDMVLGQDPLLMAQEKFL
jgi:hypothetical protein